MPKKGTGKTMYLKDMPDNIYQMLIKEQGLLKIKRRNAMVSLESTLYFLLGEVAKAKGFTHTQNQTQFISLEDLFGLKTSGVLDDSWTDQEKATIQNIWIKLQTGQLKPCQSELTHD